LEDIALIPPWLERAFSFSLVLSQWQQLGLAFLLGSFAVATLSDLRRMSAQQEFMEVWLLFVAGMLVVDFYDFAELDGDARTVLALKWGLIFFLSVLSLRQIGVLFRLAPGDVAALAAAASLLTPLLVVIFFLAAKGISLVVGPMLQRGRGYYPFMPVVSLATLAVLALGLLVSGQGVGRPLSAARFTTKCTSKNDPERVTPAESRLCVSQRNAIY
jgi:hypothetical protein